MIAAIACLGRAFERRRTPSPPTPRMLLKRALGRHEVEVHYQPVFLSDGSLAGAEALVRWRHPSNGLIGPGALLRGVESGLELDALTTLVLADAARTLARFRRTIGPIAYLGVNVPAALLEHERLPQMVEAQLRGAGTDGAGLVLELTETSEVRNWHAVKQAIHRLRPLGVQLALDDFGRGHANLPALAISDADIVKLDKSLIDQVLTNDRSREIVESVVQLAGSLKMQVVAEGIEDPEILEWLRGQNITFFQGHVLGCPQPIDELIAGRYRGVPLPALSRFPHSQRGSITVPSLVFVVLALASMGCSAIGVTKWIDVRSTGTRTEFAHNKLAHAYSELTGVIRQTRTAQIAATGEYELDPRNVLVSVPAWRLLDAIAELQRLIPLDGELAAANTLAHGANAELARGNPDEATRQVVDLVAPAVRWYLQSSPDPASPGSEAADRGEQLAELCLERMSTLTAARFRAGIDPIGEQLATRFPQPSPEQPDPIAQWLIEAQSDPNLSPEFIRSIKSPLVSISTTWPALTSGSKDQLSLISVRQVHSDILTVQLAVHEYNDRHHPFGLNIEDHAPIAVPDASWMIAGATPPALAIVAFGGWLVARDSRGKNPLTSTR